jgi:glyoxylase-like metal-dependent hydrolase (beta-lactamase superfamily II)
MDEEPDVRYRAGDRLPGGLQAIPVPGPEKAHFAFWLPREPGVLFCPDLLMHGDQEELSFIPAQYHEDPDATRQSVRRLLDFRFSVLCFDHGTPIVGDPHAALREVLERDAEQRSGRSG